MDKCQLDICKKIRTSQCTLTLISMLILSKRRHNGYLDAAGQEKADQDELDERDDSLSHMMFIICNRRTRTWRA